MAALSGEVARQSSAKRYEMTEGMRNIRSDIGGNEPAIIPMKIWRWVMIAFCTEWSLPAAERRDLCCWFELVAGLAKEAGKMLGSLGRFFLSAEVACLGQYGLLCSKMMILLDIESEHVPVRRALRRFGDVIRQMEEASHPSTSPTALQMRRGLTATSTPATWR